MSINSLSQIIGSGPERPSDGGDDLDTTLVFAFDASYLVPFKVMILSLHTAGTLLSCPVRIYTDDPSIRTDPMVAAVADEVIERGKADEAEFASLLETSLKRPEKRGWHRGTFLKWMVFEPQPTRRALFLDVDMLCLQPLEALLKMAGDADFAACPQFQNSIRKVDDRPRSSSEIGLALEKMAHGKFDGAHRTRINSGVMLVGPRLLTREFRSELVAASRERLDTNEQGLISQYFKAPGCPYRRRMLPATFNFQDSFLRLADSTTQINLLKDIHVLHYAGGAKPWTAEQGVVTARSFNLWHERHRSLLRS